MSQPDLNSLLTRVRQLNEGYQGKRGSQAIYPFRDLVQLLLSRTVLKEGESVRIMGLAGDQKKRWARSFALGGPLGRALELTNGHFLTFFMQLYIDDERKFLIVSKTYYKYQVESDPDSERWVFRYEYDRKRSDPHPLAHVHIRGGLTETDVPTKKGLPKVHFPTGRVSVESIIRLLLIDFEVKANTEEEIWRPVLDESERSFLKIAHKALRDPEE